MSEMLWGVIIGGLIGSVGTIGSLILKMHMWQKERRFQFLEEKRDRREKIFEEAFKKIEAGLRSDAYELDMAASVFKLCPTKVSRAFDNMMLDKDKTPLKKRHHLMVISNAMKESIADIETAMEKTY